MKKTNFKKGFTLIELLVVITIIGILATGASTVYISSQQRARDSVRVNDIQAIDSALKQASVDGNAYMSADVFKDADGTGTGTDAGLVAGNYLREMPTDPRTGDDDGTTQFVYVYGVAGDPTTKIAGQLYELSANFENPGNQDNKEQTDGGNDANRWETGIRTDVVYTDINTAGTSTHTNDVDGDTATSDSESPVVIDVL